jgi:prolyl oligopeptidase
LRAFDAALRPLRIALPPLNSVAAPRGFDAAATLAIDGAAYNDPRRIFILDPATGAVYDSGVTPPPPPLYASLRVTNTSAKSADGTMVPLTIISNGEPRRDAYLPVVLLGYGSYGASPFVPPIPPMYLGMVNAGIVIAAAHVRGGGELGQRWYLGGKGPNKHNTIDDFLACGRKLVADGWTTLAHLAALGSSAGGITVGRAMTTDPALFVAVVSQVGVSDTLRIENTPNGAGNVPEFGTTANEAGFHALYDMSPYEHVVAGARYPAL